MLFDIIKEGKGAYGASVVCLFNDAGAVLMLRRVADDDWMPNKFAFVGGKLRKNEEAPEAMIRELEEETGIKIKEKDLQKIHYDKNVHYFISSLKETPKLSLDKSEASAYKWATLEDINKMECVPNTKEILRKAIKKHPNKNIRGKWDGV